MKDHYDPWYVRLPDGRTIKAKSTASVRYHVEAGHIPLNSLVRRDSNEEWVGLVWVAEFSDLRKEAPVPHPAAAPAARSGVHARLDPLRLHTVGVRGLIDELVAALDCTLARAKVVPAFVASVLLYLGLYAIPALLHWLFDPPAWVGSVVAAAFAVLVLSVLNAVLAKLTHLELTTMRPARFGAAGRTLSTYLVPALVTNTIVAGGGLGLLWVLSNVPDWAAESPGDGGSPPFVRMLLLVVVLLLSVLIGLVIGLCWLLTPAIVVEESGGAGVREWGLLVRDHFGRIVVYEGLAVLLGVAISVPLTLAVGLAGGSGPGLLPPWPVIPPADEAVPPGAVLAAVHGLSAAPLLALLPVANVFIYLNMRYEQGK